MENSSQILSELQNIKIRVEKLEKHFKFVLDGLEDEKPLPPPIPKVTKPFDAEPRPFRKSTEEEPKSTMGQFLGIIAAICFVLAASFLVKLTIDSGWLTPERQVVLSACFGLLLVVIGIRVRKADEGYFSLLPAAGVIILYAAVAGGQAFYSLYPPQAAVVMMSSVSVLSIFLSSILQTEIYAAFAVIGSYLAGGYLPRGMEMSLFTTYYLIWDITFSVLSVFLGSRVMVLVSCYFALGLYQLFSPSSSFTFVAQIQFVQFLIFSVATGAYTFFHRRPLTTSEAWAFFPVLLFFYGLEYNLILRIAPDWAPWMGVTFAAVVYGIYLFARLFLKKTSLESTPVVSAVVAFVLLHSVYFGLLPGRGQLWIGALVLLIWPITLRERKSEQVYWPMDLCFALVVFLGYVRILLGAEHLSADEAIVLGFAYFASLAFIFFVSGMKFRKANDDGAMPLVLLFAHTQFIVSSYRLVYRMASQWSPEVIPFVISSVWGLFALATLMVAKKLKDGALGYSSILLLAATTLKVFLWDVSGSSPIIRIVSLMGLGVVLYICGYIMRTIGTWSRG